MTHKRRIRTHKPWDWFVRLPVLVQLVVVAAIGAVAALGQAPYHQPLAMLLAISMAFLVFRRQTAPGLAAATGWAFGLGYFAVALIWILQPFQIDPERHAWMAPFALLFLCAGLALFWGAAFWAARRVSRRTYPLILTWTAAEMLRAYVFTGFPWATPSQALVDSMAGRSLAVAGPHGANLWIMSLAWALSFPAVQTGRKFLRVGQAALLFAAVAVLLIAPHAPPAPLTGKTVRMVQPNVPQALKWDPAYFETFFTRQLALTSLPPAPGQPAPDLIIWPEAAIPWRLETASSAFAEITRSAAGTPVLLGLNRGQDGRVFNALAVLDAEGQPVQTYDKHHLVPFGEYIPLGDFLGQLGIPGAAASQGQGFSSGPGPVTLELDGIGVALPLICYEAVFAHDVSAAGLRPDMLIQITNDAWFGQDSGPEQHLAQARMRAIEQGLPLMRAANTGISAMIDPWGRVTHSLPLGEEGIVDAPLPLPRAPTLYGQTGDRPMAIFLVLAIGAMVLRTRQKPNRH